MKSFKEYKDELDIRVFYAFDLVEYLSRRLGDRFSYKHIESLTDSRVTCYFDSKEFEIDFADEISLELSTKPENKEIFDELIPIFNEVMGSQPICSYNLLRDGEEIKDALPTIEWNVDDSNKRITDIIYGRAYGKSFHNVKLYNGKKILNYIKRPANIYNQYLVSGFNELDLYVAISVMDYYINNIKDSINANVIPSLELKEFEEIREYLVYQTTRFGVELDTPGNNRVIRARFQPEVLNWYAYYDNYYRNVLTDEERQAYGSAKRSGKVTSSFMPKKNWAAEKESTSKVLKKDL